MSVSWQGYRNRGKRAPTSLERLPAATKRSPWHLWIPQASLPAQVLAARVKRNFPCPAFQKLLTATQCLFLFQRGSQIFCLLCREHMAISSSQHALSQIKLPHFVDANCDANEEGPEFSLQNQGDSVSCLSLPLHSSEHCSEVPWEDILKGSPWFWTSTKKCIRGFYRNGWHLCFGSLTHRKDDTKKKKPKTKWELFLLKGWGLRFVLTFTTEC